MARARSPNRDKAFMIYKERDGNITNREIANILKISEKTVGGWKCKDKWNDKLNGVLQKNKRSTPKEKLNKGGQPDNKNAVGHGAPVKNKNAEKHGFFSKYLPEETLEVIKEIQEKEPLDILWENITIQYAAIIRAQRIMHVKDKEELIKELKKEKESIGSIESWEKEYEFQFAWDRQANFLNAQSRAMGELRSLIKQYDEMLNKNWDLATEEQKTRIEKLKVDIENIKGNNKEEESKSWVDAIQEIATKRRGKDG
ncbi:terminase [Clostridium tetani]|uniref:phage terminase small subunit n=1 Tax=Clostridium tetani TaxID=1513 RepID=UPI00100AC60D|nr:phage terminase small subunit [Clostridium tetani]RXM79590.1 terminase [Clostridium tetani]RYV00404.1 terminase [Clostridium tetani]